MAKRKKHRGWGGVRPGSGRKPLPPGEARRHRVVVLLSDHELEALKALAAGRALGTVAYDLLVAELLRRRSV
jgi:hypothetical protein